MFRLSNKDELTPELIKRMVYKFRQNDLPRLIKLKNYYLNKTDILKRVQADPTKPNNKVVHPFSQYITDTLCGYFMGEPVSYSSEENIDELKMVFEYNDEQNENMELAKNCSIYGRAWEYMYIDDDGSIRFTMIDTKEIIPIYNDTIDDELVAIVRFYDEYNIIKDAMETKVEVYTDDHIYKYVASTTLDTLHPVSDQPHFFSCVPFVEYKNNDDMTGDFEGVMSLIDAYDALVSDDLNDFAYFCDAYLALYGYTADAEDVRKMKENRVLLMDIDTKAEWLVKQGDSTGVETTKQRLEKDIHKFSKTPNSNDENFGGNTSGVAMKYKLLGTENLASIKERKFKKGLQRRIEIIGFIFSLNRRGALDWLGVDITFTRNLPVNESDISAMVQALDGIVSKKTLLSQLSFVEDADAELEQLEKETASTIYYTAGVNPDVSDKEQSEVE
jgi:SPP1 family phage portal protein